MSVSSVNLLTEVRALIVPKKVDSKTTGGKEGRKIKWKKKE